MGVDTFDMGSGDILAVSVSFVREPGGYVRVSDGLVEDPAVEDHRRVGQHHLQQVWGVRWKILWVL